MEQVTLNEDGGHRYDDGSMTVSRTGVERWWSRRSKRSRRRWCRTGRLRSMTQGSQFVNEGNASHYPNTSSAQVCQEEGKVSPHFTAGWRSNVLL
mmetsp:Transcript_11047/g.37546  ORF Transcript_11047/g.37546 Transcript_11047/m.37546 type:complete len:95 (+) Transcript_11047:1415-1699(+)